MKTSKRTRKILKRKVSLLIAGGIVVIVIAVLLGKNTAVQTLTSAKNPNDLQEKSEVTAETPNDLQRVPEAAASVSKIPEGFAGVIEGVAAVKSSKGDYHALGTNLEDVLVGQRTAKRKETLISNMSSQVAKCMDNIDLHSWELVERTKISDKDYETLLAIVEAEAGGEDVKGRILVANVILNRVASDLFPDSVTEVVWQTSGGSPQFTPTVDGRIETVKVSDTTKEAVNRAIDGEDHSDGALFFLEKRYSENQNVAWFDSSLKFLFQHGVHSFYKY